MGCWSITSVHLVTVSVVERMMVVIYVTVSIIMMMMTNSVSVIDKVEYCYCLIVLPNVIGYLCGECRGDRGVSVLLNKCVSCGHGSIALIFGLG